MSGDKPTRPPGSRRIDDFRRSTGSPALPVRPEATAPAATPRDVPALKRPVPPRREAGTLPQVTPLDAIDPAEISAEDPDAIPLPRRRRSRAKIALGFIAGIFAAILIGGIAAVWWYQDQLQPVASGHQTNDKVHVVIESGTTPVAIAQLLKDKGLIRNPTAFSIYTQLTGTRDRLKAGTYALSRTASTQQIVDSLVSGKQDEFTLTFLPGDTLQAHRARLLDAGYSATEIDAALSATYAGPLFAGKPAGSDMEGYVYGETYRFASTATVKDIIERTTTEMQRQIEQHGLAEAYRKQGLSLYEAITLASIVQREVSGLEDRRQVAQVFLKRLHEGASLGSDVTFIYAAKKLGVTPTPDLDSPYNTRIHAGLPPGPIASPGLTALQAVASPAPGDYNYFVAGDNGKTYFARTLEEHNANIRNHCHKLCE